MNATLDKSLDDIISAGKTKRTSRNRRSAVRKSALSRKKTSIKTESASAGKEGRGAAAAGVSKKAAASIAKATNGDMTQFATRIIVSNMPKDVTENQVEGFFRSELGHIQKVTASYNARGQRTGQFTITFTRGGLAAKAMERFNGTVIDNGAAKMKVEIVFDQSARPLASRLSLTPQSKAKAAATPASATAGASKASGAAKKKRRSKTATGDKAAPAPTGDKAKKAESGRKAGRNRNKGRTAKTAEELDAEMADYFASGEAADVIS